MTTRRKALGPFNRYFTEKLSEFGVVEKGEYGELIARRAITDDITHVLELDLGSTKPGADPRCSFDVGVASGQLRRFVVELGWRSDLPWDIGVALRSVVMPGSVRILDVSDPISEAFDRIWSEYLRLVGPRTERVDDLKSLLDFAMWLEERGSGSVIEMLALTFLLGPKPRTAAMCEASLDYLHPERAEALGTCVVRDEIGRSVIEEILRRCAE